MQAEILQAGSVVAATGHHGFQTFAPTHKVQKTQRYSFQRSFVEVYHLSPGFDVWSCDPAFSLPEVTLESCAAPILIERDVPYPAFQCLSPLSVVGRGSISKQTPKEPWRDRSLVRVGPRWMGPPEHPVEVVIGYPMEMLEEIVSDDLGATVSTPRGISAPESIFGSFSLAAGEYAIIDFASICSGFLGVEVETSETVTLDIAFDGVLEGGDVLSPGKDQCNVLRLHLKPGKYRLESLEPYSMRFAKTIARGGVVRINTMWLRELAGPAESLQFAAPDCGFMQVLEAGRQTFRQNVVDLPMDCPNRERAPWFCDSFFMARVEPWLTGASLVERAHLESVLLGGDRPKLPPGMFAMVYPGDHPGGRFIPNWALFLVLQLAEYCDRSGDRSIVDGLRPRIAALFAWFDQHRGADGLLVRLPGWIFVEWSAANNLVQDINAPTNMLYAAALCAAGKMYGEEAWIVAGQALHQRVRQTSFDGIYFHDRALIAADGTAQWTPERTEVCQYYAFFCGTANLSDFTPLAVRLADDCRPGKALPDGLLPANAFIGFYLRLELLSQMNRRHQILEEMKDLFLPMAEKTGTLWENATAQASVNHGFASHVIHLAMRDVLGISLDRANRVLTLNLCQVPLPWCRVHCTIAGANVEVSWQQDANGITHRISGLPLGWRCEVQR